MQNLVPSSLSLALATLLAACSRPATPALDDAGAATLARLQHTPESAGDLIYQGAVFPLQARSDSGLPLFSYERRVQLAASTVSATHLTRDASGEVVVSESARFTPDYEVLRFDATHQHGSYSGSVTVTGGRHLQYTLNRGGQVSTATEDVRDPVVTGPSLHGFILTHWDALAAGQTLPVRMIVLSQKKSYGFEIRRVDASPGRTAFSITPSSLLVRLALDPLRVEFDTARKNVLRYQGRVPPMQRVNGKLKALDADVTYTLHAASYR